MRPVSRSGGRKRTVKSAEERRREIVAAALTLFRERGFDATAVGDVAAAAGVATGTVYLYFASKEHLLEQIHADFHAGLRQTFLEVAAELVEDDATHTAAEVTELAIDAVVAHCLAHRDAGEVIHRYLPRLDDSDPHNAEFEAVFARAIEAGVERGTFSISDPEMAARLLYTAFRGTVVEALVRGDDDELARLVAQAKELFRKVLAPDDAPVAPSTKPRKRGGSGRSNGSGSRAEGRGSSRSAGQPAGSSRSRTR